jgi:hypothetical protein
MSDVTCGVEGFGAELTSVCMKHVQGQQQACAKLVKKAAQKSAHELRSGPLTPRKTGDYASTFRAKCMNDSDGSVEYHVGNTKRRGNLTHLLEDGHELFVHGRDTGRRTRSFPHIAPAYEVGAKILREASVDQ